MKRSLPTPTSGGIPDSPSRAASGAYAAGGQQQQQQQYQQQMYREERGPGGQVLTTAPSSECYPQNNAYRSSASSVASLYSTSSTNTVFGSSIHDYNRSSSNVGGAGSGGGGGGAAASSDASASFSSLDCFNTIGSSLKRVKISTSPGELRLNKDIEAMAHDTTNNRTGRAVVMAGDGPTIVSGDRLAPWASLDEGAVGGSSSHSFGSSGGVHYYRTLRSADGTVLVRRDVVDPLRLRISVTFRTERPYKMTGWGTFENSDPSAVYETWTYLVQIPRLYPHSPPLIHRITREGGTVARNIEELIRQQRRDAFIQQQQQHFQQYSSDNAPGKREASSHRGINGPPMIERIIVSSNPAIHPPSAEECEMTGICVGIDPTPDALGTMATFGGWSPISRLSDLVTFLAELPVKRMEAWAARGNNTQLSSADVGAGPNRQMHRQQAQTDSGADPNQHMLREQTPTDKGGSRRGVVRRHLSSNNYDSDFEYNYGEMSQDMDQTTDAADHHDRQRRRTSQESEVDISAVRIAGSSTHSSSEHGQDVAMEVGQESSTRMNARSPSKMDPFHPNRFNQGFHQRSTTAATASSGTSSLWRTSSAPNVSTSAPPPSTAGPWTAAPFQGSQSDFGATSFRQSNLDSHMMDDDL